MCAIGGEQHQLLKLRNPWGSDEWEGEWGDDWMNSNASTSIKSRLKWTNADDGAFWMRLNDFLMHYDTIYMVRTFGGGGWSTLELEGEWKGATAAGCGNYRKFRRNPQYMVTISRPCHIIIMLTQIPNQALCCVIL